MVHDLEFLIRSALSDVKKDDILSIKSYYSGLLSGFVIAQAFVSLKAMTITNDVWRILNSQIDPTPSIDEFRQRVLRGTFGVVDLDKKCFVNPDLRYNKYYSVGIADAVMVGLLEVPRLLMVTDGDDWQSNTLFWIGKRIAYVDSLMDAVV